MSADKPICDSTPEGTVAKDSEYLELRTMGHATLVIVANGVPVLATDPWLIGSAYWRSWWLEKYPSSEEIELVRRARNIYLTHSHPDHFHWPSLRSLGPRRVLHPRFPKYVVPKFLEGKGYQNHILEPWVWYELSDRIRVCSIPVPIDDSLLVIDLPFAIVLNLNDSSPRSGLLRLIRRELLSDSKPIVVLKSYSPASAAALTFRDGKRAPLKTKKEFVQVALKMCEALNATYFIPFASQAFFGRIDSMWANDHKVTYEDLSVHWRGKVRLCRPFIKMNMNSLDWQSDYSEVSRTLTETQQLKVLEVQNEERSFAPPDDLRLRLESYMRQLRLVRTLYRRGIGWRLSTSSSEFFFDSRTAKLEEGIPPEHDLVITVPDRVLYEALCNNVLTDLGITLFVRVDSKVHIKRAYVFFLLMGLRDYGHFETRRSFLEFLIFYSRYFFPVLFAVWRPKVRIDTSLSLENEAP